MQCIVISQWKYWILIYWKKRNGGTTHEKEIIHVSGCDLCWNTLSCTVKTPQTIQPSVFAFVTLSTQFAPLMSRFAGMLPFSTLILFDFIPSTKLTANQRWIWMWNEFSKAWNGGERSVMFANCSSSLLILWMTCWGFWFKSYDLNQ